MEQTLFIFSDGHSGGSPWLDVDEIAIIADNVEAAKARFTKLTAYEADLYTCDCCGPNFPVTELTESKTVEEYITFLRTEFACFAGQQIMDGQTEKVITV